MNKKASKMDPKTTKILCYLGIIFALVLIIVPPVLRRFVPKPYVPPKVENKYLQLSCHTNDNSEVIVVSYVGEKEKIGQIKYTFSQILTEWKGNLLKTDLEKSLNLIKRVEESQDGTGGKSIYLLSPPSGGDNQELDVNDLYLLSSEIKQAPQQQKDYYEKLGFWCTLTDLTSDSKK